MKKNHVIQSITAISLAVFSLQAFAAPYSVTGTIDKTIRPAPSKMIQASSIKPALASIKKIKLLKIKLSPTMQKNIIRQLQGAASLSQIRSASRDNNMPSQKDLGMGSVPVLDQGYHGSCVTFANVAALDAALNKGDFISPLCSLALGKTLAQNGFYPSGWDGSRAPMVLDQFMRFGYVDTASQQQRGCGGLTQYPTRDESTGEAMSLSDYYDMSRNLSSQVSWEPIQATLQADDQTPIDFRTVVKQIKKAILDNHRVTFAILLDLDVDGMYPGATGTTVTAGDTWVLSDQIKQDALSNLGNFGGHEMIITGYNDDAVVTDENGVKHTGAFTLRNSWGANTGNNGTFFMSYDYAQFMLLEAQRIVR